MDSVERIKLRPFHSDDVLPLHKIFSDPISMQYWSRLPHSTIQETESMIETAISMSSAGLGDDLIIEFIEPIVNLSSDPQEFRKTVIGKCGLWNNEEIGIMISKEFCGRGIGTEAVQKVISRAREKGLPKISADIDPRNVASLNLFQKCGFRVIGEAKATFLLGTTWVDSIYMELLL